MHLFSYPLSPTPHNATTRDAVSYSIVDDLTQTPMAMSALEVLKMCPTQWNALLATLGAVDPSNSKLITFDMENGEPWMPSTIAFQIPVSIRNLVMHRCIVDETYILKADSFRIFCMMIFPEILHASDEVVGPTFVKNNCIYIYRILHGVYMLLRREIPMAWGTTIDSLTPEINLFQ